MLALAAVAVALVEGMGGEGKLALLWLREEEVSEDFEYRRDGMSSRREARPKNRKKKKRGASSNDF
jgi:hypothetical protein